MLTIEIFETKEDWEKSEAYIYSISDDKLEAFVAAILLFHPQLYCFTVFVEDDPVQIG